MSDDSDQRELLESALREHVRGMSEDDFRTFVAETRPPNSVAQLKRAAQQIISGDRLNAWVGSADPSKFVDDDGDVDEEKVIGALTTLFGASHQDDSSQRQSWGQHSGNPPGQLPGDAGRAEAARRYGTKPPETPQPDAKITRGAAGRAEALKRFGPKNQGRQQ